jgi:trimethylamine--corrinoid protein Co-methyltransferase
MDAEQCGAFHVIGRGLTLDENALALDAFAEVGPGKHFLGSAHTMRNYETAFHNFELSDSNSFEQWTEEGSRDIVERANAKWKRMLADYVRPPIEAASEAAVLDFVARRKSELPDAWY